MTAIGIRALVVSVLLFAGMKEVCAQQLNSRQAILQAYGAQQWLKVDELGRNLFAFKGILAAIPAGLDHMVSEHEGVFNSWGFPLFVSNLPSGYMEPKNGSILIARVVGISNVATPMGALPLPHVEFTARYNCTRGCWEIQDLNP